MSDKHYIGLDVTSFENTGKHKPISRVTLFLDSENYYTAGDDTGKEITSSCPSATQAMTDNLLAALKGYEYQSFKAEAANIDPAAELGDGVTVGGIYSVVSRFDDKGTGYLNVSSPGEAEVEEEYPYQSPFYQELNRKIAQTRSLITKTAEEIRLEVIKEIDGVESAFSSLELTVDGLTTRVQGAEGNISSLEQTAQGFALSISDLEGGYAEITATVDGLTVKDSSGTTKIKGSSIETDSLYVNAANISGTLTANQVNLTGAITFGDLSSDVNNSISGISSLAVNAYNKANSAESQVSAWTYSGTTYIDGSKILTGTVTASNLYGGAIGLINASMSTVGTITLGAATSGSVAVDIKSAAALHLYANSGDMWLQSSSVTSPYLWIRGTSTSGAITCGGHFWPGENGIYNLGRSDLMWDGLYSKTSSATASDRNEKNSITDIPEEYVSLFMGLRPRLYKYNKGTSGRYHLGYIAQEVEEAMQAAGIDSMDLAALVIDYDADGNKIYMLRYEEFMALHTMMIQRLVNQNG